MRDVVVAEDSLSAVPVRRGMVVLFQVRVRCSGRARRRAITICASVRGVQRRQAPLELALCLAYLAHTATISHLHISLPPCHHLDGSVYVPTYKDTRTTYTSVNKFSAGASNAASDHKWLACPHNVRRSATVEQVSSR